MTVARRVAWNTAAQAGARVTTLALAVLTTVLLTRHLGVSGYGVYVTVTVYVPFFALVFDWGITTSVVRELSKPEHRAQLFREALGLRLALALPVMLLALGIGLALYGGASEGAIRRGVAIMLPLILFASAASALTAVFQARLEMDRVALAEIAGQTVAAALIVVLVVAGRPIEEVFGAVVAGSLVNMSMLLLLASRLGSVRPIVDLSSWMRLLRQSLPLGLSLMISTVYFRADAILLSVLKGAHAVGIYGVAYRLLEAVIAFPGFFYVSVFPLLARAAAERDVASVRGILQRAFDVLVLGAVPIVLGTIAVAPELVHALAGGGFDKAVTPLRIVIAGGGMMFLNGLFAYVLVALDRQSYLLAVTAGALVLNVVLNLVLIPRYSYIAAAAIATGSEAVILVALVGLVRRFAGFVPSLGVAAKAALAGGAMVAVLVATPSNLALLVAVGAALYGGVLLLLRTHRSLELRELLSARR